MSLLSELQQITERTYQQSSGINLEKFIIGKQRFQDLSQLAGTQTRELSEAARMFFRVHEDNLFLAIYFADSVISTLEQCDPRSGLSEKNILPFMVFVEEINHGIHTALKFRAGDRMEEREEFACDLELMAKVDSYQILKFFLAYFNDSKQLESFDRLWLRHHVFERGDFTYDDTALVHRYQETTWLGEKYTRFLDNIPTDNRLGEMRRFREMPYLVKSNYIRMLP